MSDILTNSLELILEKNSPHGQEKPSTSRKQVINQLKSVFQVWCNEGQVLTLGSYHLGVDLLDSDIDLLCVAPSRYTREEFQQDFYSRLETLDDLSCINGVFQTKVPVIKLVLKGIRVDIQFASTDEGLTSSHPSDLDEASLLGINAYKSSNYILSVVPSQETFQVFCRAVKFWASKRNLSTSGGLSGMSWTLLCAKICMIYPGLSAVNLMQKFFKIYSRWDWSVPISINSSCFVSTSYNPFMTILTPVSPAYNTAYTLTPSGFAMICSELELGAKIMKEVVEGLQDLSALFEEIDFFQQFRYFIKLEIMACGSQDYETWSGLVLSRVKNLLLDLERVYPRPQVCFYAKSFELLNKQFKNSKVFFIGLKFHVSQCVKLDLRGPIQNFCGYLNEMRPNKSTMCLKCSFLNKKDLMNSHAKHIKIGSATHN